MDVKITSYSNHHINSIIKLEDGALWRFAGIYGHPEQSQKKHTQRLLRRLAALFSISWLCGGDFNEITHSKEKKGGLSRNSEEITEFKIAIQDCGLYDLGWSGYPYTWSNKRFGGNLIEERLDRFLCT